MNKIKPLFLVTLSGLVLAACGGETETTAPAEETTQVDTTAEETNSTDTTEIETEEDGNVTESEFGTITTLAQVTEINETQESGPFSVTVEAIQKSQLQPTADYVEMFGGEDLAVITVQLSVENSSEETNSIYPDQGTIVTDTQQQVSAELFLSDEVGGDFIGEVVKSGAVQFIFDGNAEEINSFKYIVGAGIDSEWNNFGEDLTFEFTF